MAVQYLQHEFRKILPEVFRTQGGRVIDRDFERLSKRQGEVSFWNLLAGVSEDWKLKSVFRVLSDSRFSWKKKKIPVRGIILTGMSPLMDEYVIKKCDRSPIAFGEMWKKDKKMRDKIKKSGFSAHSERDHFPIFVAHEDGKYKVFDGMRRTLLAIIGNKRYITAWVGDMKRKNEKPIISEGFCYVFSQIYKNGKRTKKQNDAFVEVGKIISKEYENGRDVLRTRIGGWSHDGRIKEIFERMIK